MGSISLLDPGDHKGFQHYAEGDIQTQYNVLEKTHTAMANLGPYVVAVLNAVLGQTFRDVRGLWNYITTHLSTSTSSVSSEASSKPFKAFTAYYEHTLYIGNKEASARGILCLFMESVRDALHKRHPKKEFKVDHEFKVLRFTSDVALIVAITGQNRMDVVFSPWNILCLLLVSAWCFLIII